MPDTAANISGGYSEVLRVPELLAPVGREEHLTAAIEEGADAIYLGASDLNARGERAQFSAADLPHICERAHAADVKVYLALNILLHNEELAEALSLASDAFSAGVDAAIVQDRGLAKVLHEYLPELPLHASTQFSVTSAEALRQLPALGFTRVVAPRELLLPELKAYVKRASELNLEVEVFIQGAMCISVSGQCLMSWAEGTRSANRGDCAQPCRLKYQLLQDGKAVGQPRRLISPSDMSRAEDLTELASAGVISFKIEGRLRSENYVRTAVRVYRQLLDRMAAGSETGDVDHETALLHTAFSRGPSFNRGYDGGRGRKFLSGERSSHYGLYAGEVGRISPYKGELIVYSQDDPLPELKPGAVWSLRDEHQNELASAPIHQYELRSRGMSHTVLLRGFHPAILRDLEGKKVSAYLMSYPLEEPSPQEAPASARLDLTLSAEEGSILLTGKVYRGHSMGKSLSATIRDTPPEAYSAQIDEARIKKQLSKLGGTAYEPGTVTVEAAVHAPVSWLNSLRRSLIEALDAQADPIEDPPGSGTSGKVRSAAPDIRKFKGGLARLLGESYEDAKPSVQAPAGERNGERILDFVSWQGAPVTAEVIRRLSDDTDPDFLLLPLDKLVRYGIPELPAGIRILADVPVSLPFKLWEQTLAAVPDLDLSAAAGIVTAGDLTDALRGILPAAFAKDGFRLIAGPGSQVTNEISLRELADQGFTDIYLDDLVTRGTDDSWILGLPERFPTIRFWVPGKGCSRSMTLRFCPVGYSEPSCTLCQKNRFSLKAEDGTVFDLANERARDCSALLLSSEDRAAGSHLSPALSHFPQWMGESTALPVDMIQSSAHSQMERGSQDESD